MASANDTVTSCKLDSCDPNRFEWLEDFVHTRVEQVRQSTTAAALVLDMFQTGSGEVTEQRLSVEGRLLSNLFWDVTNCEIDGVRRFVTE